MKKVKAILSLLLAIVMVLALTACGSGNDPAQTPGNAASANQGGSQQSGNNAAPGDSGNAAPRPITDEDGKTVIRVGIDELGRFLEGLSPSENYAMCTVIYDAIFRTDPYTMELVSDCLESWEWEDEHHFRMTLKDGVTFSNGQKATAEDLLFSYSNHADRGSNYVSNMNIDFDKCEIRDERTCVLYATTATLAIQRQVLHLYCKSWCEEVGWESEEWYKPVVSGPYEVSEFKYGDYAVLTARDDYWNKDAEPAFVDKWYVKQYTDAEAMLMDLELGNLDLCQATSADYTRYLNEPNKESLGYAVHNDLTGAVEYLSFDLIGYPELWGNKDARLAIAHGVDWESVGMLIGKDMYVQANGFVADNSPYAYDPGKYEYDTDLAKEYMAKAGLDPATKTMTMTIMNTAAYNNFAEALAFYLQDLGFKTDFQAADISAALAAWMTPGSCDFCMFWNNSGNNFGDTATTMSTSDYDTGCSWQMIGVPDAKFRELYRAAMDPLISDAERIEADHALSQYCYDECLAIPFAHYPIAFAYNTNTLTETIVDAITFCNRYQFRGFYQESAWEK